MSKVEIVHADCLEAMRGMADNSVEAIVTDPPYGLEFMGKEWDSFKGEAWRSGAGMSKPGIGDRRTEWPSFGGGDAANATCAACGGRMRGAKKCRCDEPDWRVKGAAVNRNGRSESMRAFGAWCEEWAREALRVAKPGAHLLSFGGTRTYHRLAVAIEDAGWEIRDCVMWVYGSGFPKSLDVSKAIDKAAGAEREVVGTNANYRPNSGAVAAAEWFQDRSSGLVTAPATDAARRWEGWGTALKPAWEPVIVARKPLVGTVAENVRRHGTGALNIAGCRVSFTSDADKASSFPGGKLTSHGSGSLAGPGSAQNAERSGFCAQQHAAGRWPANVVHDGSDDVVALFPQSNSNPQARHRNVRQDKTQYRIGGDYETDEYGDSGSAARFFYCAKASKADRGEGNTHATVKPLTLMRYLCRLVTPPGGTVLDPFAGSGTTLLAAQAEGFNAIGIEREAEYVEIIRSRLAARSGPLFGK